MNSFIYGFSIYQFNLPEYNYNKPDTTLVIHSQGFKQGKEKGQKLFRQICGRLLIFTSLIFCSFLPPSGYLSTFLLPLYLRNNSSLLSLRYCQYWSSVSFIHCYKYLFFSDLSSFKYILTTRGPQNGWVGQTRKKW